MHDIRIPKELQPLDGRFGCGPSLVRTAQIDRLTQGALSILGTSHRQSPVKTLVGSVQTGLAELFHLPEGYEVVLGNGGSTAFWDAAAFGLIEERAQLCAFGEFGGKFAKAAAAPWLAAPEVRRAEPGSLIRPEYSEGVDVYAWPHNETSTGAMAPVERVGGEGDLTVIDATSAAGGVMVAASEFDVYYFAPQKNFGSDGGLWIALCSPEAIERIERIAATDRYIPEFLSLKQAVENSRKQQTLNTPALATLLLLDEQVNWMNAQGGLRWCDERTRESSQTLYRWAGEHDWVTPFVSDEQARSQVVVTLDLADSIDAAAVSKQLRNNGILDTEPYRKLGRNQLRIATFVGVDPADVVRLTKAIEFVVERLNDEA